MLESLLRKSKKWYVLSCVQFFATPRTMAHQVPQFMEFSMQEHGSGLPFPIPEHLFDPEMEPVSPALASSPLRYPGSINQNSYKCSHPWVPLRNNILQDLTDRGWEGLEVVHSSDPDLSAQCLMHGSTRLLGLLANDGGSHTSHRDTAVQRWMPNHNCEKGAQKGRISSATMILTSHLEAQVFYSHLELLANVYSVAKSK